MGFVVRRSIGLSFFRVIAFGVLALSASACAPKFNFSPSLDIARACIPSGAYQLAFSTQPSASISAGQALPNGGVIEVQDNCGNLISTGSLASATISLSDASGNGSIAGVMTVTASGGIATIPNNTLSFEKAGTTMLAATATVSGYGALTGTSADIAIAAPSFSTVEPFSGPDDPNGDVDGDGTASARLNYPDAIVGFGSYVYIAEPTPMCVIRRYDTASPYDVTTWTGQLYDCGTTDGAVGTNTIGATLYDGNPWNQLATDGTNIYFADNCSIRAAAISDGTVTTIAGNPGHCGTYKDDNGTSARFGAIGGIYINSGTLYVADNGNHYIRALDLSSPYTVSTVAGNGTGAIQDSSPGPAEVDSMDQFAADSNNIYFTDYDGTHQDIRQMAFSGNAITTDVTDLGTICGGSSNEDNYPIAVSGTTLYMSCPDNTIMSATIGTWSFSIVAGQGWQEAEADGGVGTSLLDGVGSLWPSGSDIYFSDTGDGTLRVLDDTHTVTTVAGTPNAGMGWTMNSTAADSRFTKIMDMTSDGTHLYAFTQYSGIAPISLTDGSTGSTLTSVYGDFFNQMSVAMGGKIYVANGCEIGTLDPGTDTYTVVVGSGTCAEQEGPFSSAEFEGIQAIASDQNNLYVFDNDVIKKLDMATQTVSVLSGSLGSNGCATGSASASLYQSPPEMTYLNGEIYFSQWQCGDNQIIQVNTTTGASAVFAGNGSYGSTNGTLLNSSFGGYIPDGYFDLQMTTDGVNLYVLDKANGLVREINVADGTVSTLYGSTSQIWQVDGSLSSAREGAGTNTSDRQCAIYYGYGKLYVGDVRGIRVVQ